MKTNQQDIFHLAEYIGLLAYIVRSSPHWSSIKRFSARKVKYANNISVSFSSLAVVHFVCCGLFNLCDIVGEC